MFCKLNLGWFIGRFSSISNFLVWLWRGHYFYHLLKLWFSLCFGTSLNSFDYVNSIRHSTQKEKKRGHYNLKVWLTNSSSYWKWGVCLMSSRRKKTWKIEWNILVPWFLELNFYVPKDIVDLPLEVCGGVFFWVWKLYSLMYTIYMVLLASPDWNEQWIVILYMVKFFLIRKKKEQWIIKINLGMGTYLV